ncbi:MAG: aldehyde dehydrogenase [Phycisphaeraceae bacterium]|nr:aldehyde dehydrogenase [Phycisphaeraceae bacterium]
MLRLTNFIANQDVPARAGRWLDVFEPATGRAYAQAPESDGADVEAAVGAARAAFAEWSELPPAERSRLMLRLADLIDANVEALAEAESRDTGKPITLARTLDIPRCATNFRHFATAILHWPSEVYDSALPGPGGAGVVRSVNFTVRRPRGVAGLIAPWNLPLYLLTWKIAPAIATGNTCVCKPSEVTPVTAWMLGSLVRQAGLPAGVVNIVHGTGQGAGAALVAHPDVPTVSFTGSTAVGRWIGERAGAMLKRVSLELGGKNPFIVFDDADADAAAEAAARAAFTNQGQICLCGSRLLVQAGVYERVLARVVAGAKARRVGDPADGATEHGAMVSRAHLEKVDGYVRLARELGGTVHCGGEPVARERLPERCRDGCFYPPTVISGLAPDCRVEQEEIFGPVVTVRKFETEEQALALANGTAYGLAASVWTNDAARAHRMGARLDAGVIWVNCWMVRDLRTPFGGTKASGVGREGGVEALRFFTEPRNVCLRL